LVATSLTINQPPPVTMQERQMAEQLADTIALLSKGPKFDYYEEITLDLGEMSDEEHSAEEEETSEIEAGTEEADPDWQDKEKAIDKYNLKNYSEDFMRQVVNFADETNRFGKRSHICESIRRRFKAVPDQKYISGFRRYLEYHETKRQKT
ncbi:unnamed protein product, partial [Didymodactylos carnosus]